MSDAKRGKSTLGFHFLSLFFLRLISWFLPAWAKVAHTSADKITRSVMCFQPQRFEKLFGSFAPVNLEDSFSLGCRKIYFILFFSALLFCSVGTTVKCQHILVNISNMYY